MNQQMLMALADQRVAELRATTADQDARAGGSGGRPERPLAVRVPRQSLRVRTGWTLVGIGLRMVAEPRRGMTGRPRPASS